MEKKICELLADFGYLWDGRVLVSPANQFGGGSRRERFRSAFAAAESLIPIIRDRGDFRSRFRAIGGGR